MQDLQNNIKYPAPADNTASIFDDIQPLPVYYSQTAIYGFCIFFGPLFGAVLMAMNLRRTPAKKGIWQVIVFGILLTVAQLLLISSGTRGGNNFGYIFGGIAAGIVIKNLVWPNYIGTHTAYTKRPIWIPLIIGCILAGISLLEIFTGVR